MKTERFLNPEARIRCMLHAENAAPSRSSFSTAFSAAFSTALAPCLSLARLLAVVLMTVTMTLLMSSIFMRPARAESASGDTSGYDGPAQLPVATVASAMADTPAPGPVVNVPAGGDLQSALNNAQCGETIELQ